MYAIAYCEASPDICEDLHKIQADCSEYLYLRTKLYLCSKRKEGSIINRQIYESHRLLRVKRVEKVRMEESKCQASRPNFPTQIHLQ